MRHLTEIRWHGRGGQGAKTAALLLADVAFGIGKHVQGFPEYGPERMGAPITAYDRISDSEIRVHSNIYEPDFVAVVDDTLLHSVDVTAGLRKEGAVLINTEMKKEEILPLLKGYEGAVYIIDARKVCMETLGKYGKGRIFQGNGNVTQAQIRKKTGGIRRKHAGALQSVRGSGACQPSDRTRVFDAV